jgi:hypothetical protein
MTPGQLAQFRGCESWNDCFFDCCGSADMTLTDAREGGPAAIAEVEEATTWAATQTWAPPAPVLLRCARCHTTSVHPSRPLFWDVDTCLRCRHEETT